MKKIVESCLSMMIRGQTVYTLMVAAMLGVTFIATPVNSYASDLSTVPLDTEKAVQTTSNVIQNNLTKDSSRSSKQFSKIQKSGGAAAVAMPDRYSAAVAKSILQQGGNAVDAAVAAAFVLAVTYPEAGNIGGGGFMTLMLPKIEPRYPLGVKHNKIDIAPLEKSSHNGYFLDYREMAPKASFKDLYLDKTGKVIPYQSLIGYQASGVPGTVMGMWQVHQQFGSLPWKLLLQPAIDFAQDGFEVPESMLKTSKWFANWISQNSPAGEKTKLNFDKFLKGYIPGQPFKQFALAKTLQRIANLGAQEFYFGQTAKLLAEQMQVNNGLISEQDLQGYRAKWRQPVIATWQDKTVVSAPPPSSGGIALVQLLKLYELRKADFQAAKRNAIQEGIPVEVIRAHYYAELSKRVYADRAHFLGDPDFIDVPVQQLVSNEYLQQRAQSISLNEISNTETMQPGKIESPETTHFSIVDSKGNAVANTYTLNMPFGNGVLIEQAGFLMNNEMDDFSTKPGVANIFGVVGASANAIAPEKRMLSSMTPTIVARNNQVEMVLGTPGGSTIITSNFQILINVYENKMPLQQAIDATRVHHQLLPKDLIVYNPELDSKVKENLELMGYRLKRNNYLGDMQVIYRDREQLQAASDFRGRGVSHFFYIVD